MTEVQNKILAYLIENINTDNEITISNAELAKQCDVNLKTIQKFQKDAVNEGVLSFDKGKYVINENVNVDYTYLISNTLKDKDLTLTPNEKKVLGYIAKRYNDRDNGEEYGFSDLQHIADNCKITPTTVSRIVKKLVKDSLIEIIKGDWKEKRATQFKVLFGDTVQNPIVNNNNPTIDNNSNNNININLPDNTEVLNKILNELTELKKSMINQANKFNVVEGVAKMLLDYIEEIHSDMDNLYMINNIQVPKSDKRINIEEIRKYIDTF
jgi:DNA-binding Lrp family transcriptional regulator